MNYAHRLIEALSTGPNIVTTAKISQHLGVDWRTLSSRLLAHSGVTLALAALGWEYRPRRGCKGGLFIRAGADGRLEVEGVIRLPWATIAACLLEGRRAPVERVCPSPLAR